MVWITYPARWHVRNISTRPTPCIVHGIGEFSHVKAKKASIGARLRIVLGPERALGPGKADLLHRIAETGSIAAAGRAMTMSYRRAWLLVEEMNAMFHEPLVETTKGGRGGGGGAVLTPLGREVLRRYRNMERSTARAISKDLDSLRRLLRA